VSNLSDKIRVTLDYTGQTAGLDISAKILTAKAGTALIQDTLSGQRGQYAYDTSASALYINFNADNLLTTSDYKVNVNAASTATASIADGDVNFVITGGTGADTITAGNGADTVSGGAGADVFQYNTGNAPSGESITGGADTDILQVITSTTFVAATFGTGTVLTSGAVEDIVITTGQTATFTAAQLDGQAISFNASAAGAANLVITCAATGVVGFSTLAFIARSGNAFDTGTDTVTINAGATSSTIVATTLADIIVGGAGADVITGGTGGDTITVATGDTIVYVGDTASASDTNGGAAITSGVTDIRTNLDIVTFSGGVTGHTLAINLAATNSTIVGGVITQATTGNGLAGTNANATPVITKGTYVAATGVFTSTATTPTHTLVQYDCDNATAGGVQNILIVGVFASAAVATEIVTLTF
jgi:Ca2+-binding RTX toxin-like protein